jgi:hypothetical protein
MDKITVAWIGAIVCSTIGWGSLLHFTWITYKWPKSRGRVIGNIAEWKQTGGSSVNYERTNAYFAEIEFSAAGTMHIVKGGIGRSKPWPIGETIDLQYKPNNPGHTLDFNWWQRLLFSGTFITFGSLCYAAAKGWIS